MISFVASENQVFCLNCKLQQSVKCIEATGLDGGAPVAREAGGDWSGVGEGPGVAFGLFHV